MNEPQTAEAINPKVNKTTREQLADRASPRCSKCGGRGHKGVNVDTGKYVLCQCVKRATKPKIIGGTATVDRMLAEAAVGRIVQNERHLVRLHDAIQKAQQDEQAIAIAVAEAGEMSDEEYEARLIMDAEMRRVGKMREVAANYADAAENLDAEADSIAELASSLSAMAKELLKEAGRLNEISKTRAREAAARVIIADSEERAVREEGKHAAVLSTQRAVRVHKVEKRLRETQGRIEKLMVRAGKVKGEIEKDREIVGGE